MWSKRCGQVFYDADGGAGGGDGGKSFSQDDVNRLVGSARQEARDRATKELLSELGIDKVDDLKTIVTTHLQGQQAGKTEVEKLKGELAEREKLIGTLRQQNRTYALRHTIASLTGEHAVANAELAMNALLADGLEFDEHDAPKDLEDAIKKLLEKYPLLKATTGVSDDTSGGDDKGAKPVGNPANPARQGKKLTREDVAKMTPAQINANWDAVKMVLENK